MSKGLRRTLIVGAALLIFGVLLWIRLDISSIKAHLDREISNIADLEMNAEQASLTALHGIGLRLDSVSLKHEQYQIQAGHINISIRLLPLLLGKVEAKSLDIHDALIKIRPGTMQLTSASLSSLPVERIHLIRSNIQTMDGKAVLNDLHLELRDIGPNRETLWEIQAQQDKESISGHGRLGFQAGEIKSGFGKLKLEQVSLTRIQPFTPKSVHPFINQENGMVSGALTLDIAKNNDWAVFGELKLNSDDNEKPIKLRGKFSHPEKDHVNWRDSFIHLSDSAVIAIDGECILARCSTRLQASNIELQTWSPVIPAGIKFHQQLSGTTGLEAEINWDDEAWHGDIDFNLSEGLFRYKEEEIPLPELQLNADKLSGNATSWQAEASLTSPDISGNMQIISAQKPSGHKQMFIEANVVKSKLWQPLANLLLASLDIQPAISASGTINGTLSLVQQDKDKKLELQVDAGLAKITYGDQFNKPEKIPARCTGEIHWSGTKGTPVKSISLQDCQVGSATLERMNWSNKKQKQQLKISNLAINFDQLKAKSVRLSEQSNPFRGFIKGSSSSSWSKSNTALWLQNMSGNWQLQNFGREQWNASGKIKANNGEFSSEHLLLEGMHGLAELKGHLSPARQLGSIELISAHLDGTNLPAPPAELLQKMVISGTIKQTQLTLLQNNWQDIKAAYVWRQGKLQLKGLKSTIAGGEISAGKLTLHAKPEALDIHGKVRFKNVQLQEVQGLNPLLQAEMKGVMHANIELHGSIPDLQVSHWQQSNGDILIYSGEWKQQAKAESITEKLGFRTPETRSYAFKKLEGRFRIEEMNTRFSSIKLLQKGDHYRGSAKISADGKLSGKVEQQQGNMPYAVSGEWPYFIWQPIQ
ncbi:hypothetical protein MMIC_P0225 [Mariprofundus micogutta]|uniref:Uncharacterized protein n=1 Tax=Mariprofundus micogutta TaxID=1921010 RepID=A0A1L8CK58_9PROT|nr:hypothetical protein [Mariprofundus micogutta]GAV19292.1 hypothetical protein MMIC_P0225 [Mariprofundus micogutta]